MLPFASEMNFKGQPKRIVIANSFHTIEINNLTSQEDYESKQVQINEIDGASW